MFSAVILPLSLLGLASAVPYAQTSNQLGAPTPQEQNLAGCLFDATFDALSSADPYPCRTPIGIHNDLYFQGLNVSYLGGPHSNARGLNAESAPHVATYDLYQAIEQETPALLTNYTNSNTEAFELHSFWFGCVLATTDFPETSPRCCTLTVNAYGYLSEYVGSQNFTFEATGAARQGMSFARLNSNFTDLSGVTFSTQSWEGEAVATMLDNIKYTAYEYPTTSSS